MAKVLSVAILNLQNELNVGSIVRTSNAAGVDEIIIIGRKKWNKSAATGSQHKSALRNMRTTDEFLDYCNKNNYSLVCLEISKVSQNIFDFVYPEKTMLIVGNEGTGIPEKILNRASSVVQIPQFGDVECMNAAASASIAIYDWVRKEQTKQVKGTRGFKFE